MTQLSQQIGDSLSAGSLVRKMFEEGNRLKAQHGADNVCDFSLGNPHLEPPPALLHRLNELAADRTPGMHRYMQNPGFPDVRAKVAAAVSKDESVTVPPEHVVMTVGAASALNVIFRTLLNPGEKVVLFKPYFAEYRFYVMHAGAECLPVATTADFDLDPASLAAAIDDRTRVVLLNSPNNPTGRVYPAGSIDRLVEVLVDANRRRSRPIVLVTDEPYRRLIYDGVEYPTLFRRYPHTIRATSFSKDLGLAGERIGYLALHPDFDDAPAVLAGAIFCLRTLGFVNAPALMQRLIADLLDVSVDVAAYQRNRDALYAGLRDIGYNVIKPEGAFFLFPRSPIADDREFISLLQQELVLAVPGVGFAQPGYFRLSYAVEPRIIPQALPRFRAVFERAIK